VVPTRAITGNGTELHIFRRICIIFAATTDGNHLRNSSPVEMHCHPNDTVDIVRREFKTDVKQQVLTIFNAIYLGHYLEV
jgi:hypothetical protein